MSLIERIRDDLATLGDITSRTMFGGIGLYWSGTIFGIVFQGRLYLKVDDRSRDGYLARGVGPFRPNERQTLKSYHEVPTEVVAEREALVSWVKEAVRAAHSSNPAP
jgi:DNA transformation protein